MSATTIEFPCLQTDLSKWFKVDEGKTATNSCSNDIKQKQEELIKSLEKFLISTTAVDNGNNNAAVGIKWPATLDLPQSSWLDSDRDVGGSSKRMKTGHGLDNWLSTKNNADDSCSVFSSVDLMAPVKTPPTSAKWLAEKEVPPPTETRPADLSTSLWVSSTSASSSSLTCSTAAAAKMESQIEWPSILFAKSHRIWLDQRQIQDDDDEEIAEDHVQDDAKKIVANDNHGLLDAWFRKQDLGLEHFLAKKRRSDKLDLWMPDSSSSSSMMSSAMMSSTAYSASSDGWLMAAASSSAAQIADVDDVTVVTDDMSSIAIIDEDDDDGDDDDFQLVKDDDDHEDDDDDDLGFWLL